MIALLFKLLAASKQMSFFLLHMSTAENFVGKIFPFFTCFPLSKSTEDTKGLSPSIAHRHNNCFEESPWLLRPTKSDWTKPQMKKPKGLWLSSCQHKICGFSVMEVSMWGTECLRAKAQMLCWWKCHKIQKPQNNGADWVQEKGRDKKKI